MGASVVNALSERLDVWVDRGGQTHHMAFRRGEPGQWADAPSGPSPASTFAPFTTGSQIDITGKVAKARTGTRTRYWADRQIFNKNARFSYEDLLTRARQTAFLVPGLTLTIRDERNPAEPHEESFRYDGGAKDFVDFVATDAGITDTWEIQGKGSYKETVPVLKADGALVSEEVERECVVDIALRWGVGYETEVRSFVNIISTPKGGTHQAGFETGLTKIMRKVIETNARRLKAHGQGRRRAHREGRHHGGADRHRHGPYPRAAVRGSDQGGLGHHARARHRREDRRDGTERYLHQPQARPQAAGKLRAREDRGGDAGAGRGSQAEGDLAA
ncbi:hypothetical protein GCM10025876_01450 [Demequina litorisediminis]|uniref:DNA topoisomerase (ATP-hydrolyzing) n=1 Tax=Demequina litorisediminis TaxID=1849022 RepID=A0ABQ6I8B1_9MICO|nr:hypothetical protein [Demequina litorisediminis]GMA33941.1 hypothetical protein GCM10025876_01450 [Demequina litorisediminis]